MEMSTSSGNLLVILNPAANRGDIVYYRGGSAQRETDEVCRLHDWLEGISPHVPPLSHFARLMKEAA